MKVRLSLCIIWARSCLGLCKTAVNLAFWCIPTLVVSTKTTASGHNGAVLPGTWTCPSSLNGPKRMNLEKSWVNHTTLPVCKDTTYVVCSATIQRKIITVLKLRVALAVPVSVVAKELVSANKRKKNVKKYLMYLKSPWVSLVKPFLLNEMKWIDLLMFVFLWSVGFLFPLNRNIIFSFVIFSFVFPYFIQINSLRSKAKFDIMINETKFLLYYCWSFPWNITVLMQSPWRWWKCIITFNYLKMI